MANRLRSGLTALTVALGAGAMALLVSLASNALQTILSGVDAVGGRELVFVEPQKPKKDTAQSASPLTLEDAQALRARVPGLAQVSYLMSIRGQIMQGDGKKTDVDVAAGRGYLRFLQQQIIRGHDLPAQEDSDAREVVLSTPVAKALFGDVDSAVNKGVMLWGHRYLVVGVSSELPALGFNMGGVSKSRAVFVPARTVVHAEGFEPRGFIVLRDDGTVSHDQQMRIASTVFSWRHRGVDDVEYFDLRALLRKFETVFAGLRVIVGLVASVSLVIAGAGIMNVMLASVRQRVVEVGIRRALGASAVCIKRQFLIESMLIAVSGGVVGTAGGVGICWLFGIAIRQMSAGWHNGFSVGATLAAFCAASLTGLLFGLRPAETAAGLSVVDCLRGQ